LPIGGLNEKLIAAKRFNLMTVIIPKENEKDLQDIPAEVKEGLHIYPVKHMDEVCAIAFGKRDL